MSTRSISPSTTSSIALSAVNGGAEDERTGEAGRARAVEAEADGSPDALERFEAWLRRGPSYASVESVEAEPLAREGRYRGFAID